VSVVSHTNLQHHSVGYTVYYASMKITTYMYSVQRSRRILTNFNLVG